MPRLAIITVVSRTQVRATKSRSGCLQKTDPPLSSLVDYNRVYIIPLQSVHGSNIDLIYLLIGNSSASYKCLKLRPVLLNLFNIYKFLYYVRLLIVFALFNALKDLTSMF